MSLIAYLSGIISRELGLRFSCFLHIILTIKLMIRYQNVFLQFYCIICASMTLNAFIEKSISIIKNLV